MATDKLKESLKASILPNNSGFLKKILFFEMVMTVTSNRCVYGFYSFNTSLKDNFLYRLYTIGKGIANTLLDSIFFRNSDAESYVQDLPILAVEDITNPIINPSMIESILDYVHRIDSKIKAVFDFF